MSASMVDRYRVAHYRAQGAEGMLAALQLAYRFHVAGDPLVDAADVEAAIADALRYAMPPCAFDAWKAQVDAQVQGTHEDTARGFVCS